MASGGIHFRRASEIANGGPWELAPWGAGGRHQRRVDKMMAIENK